MSAISLRLCNPEPGSFCGEIHGTSPVRESEPRASGLATSARPLRILPHASVGLSCPVSRRSYYSFQHGGSTALENLALACLHCTGTKARTSLAKIKLQGTSFGSSIHGRTDGLTISNGQEPNSPAEPPSAESRFTCSPSMLRTSSRCEPPSWKKTHLLSKSRRGQSPPAVTFSNCRIPPVRNRPATLRPLDPRTAGIASTARRRAHSSGRSRRTC